MTTRHRPKVSFALDIAAARLDEAGANLALVKDVRDLAARFRLVPERTAESEQVRVERQRTLMACVFDSRGKDRLQQAMFDRAADLIGAGELNAADALLEFLPSPQAERLLDELLGEV